MAAQAVEAKEGFEMKADSSLTAEMTFQAFFRSYARICGMTVRTDFTSLSAHRK